MVYLVKRKYGTLLFFLIVLNFASQIRSVDMAAGEINHQGSNDASVNAEKANAQETDAFLCEDEKDNAKPEKIEQEHKNVEIKSEHEKGEENEIQGHSSNEKQEPEKEEANDQQANVQDDKSEGSKQEASNNDAPECKKQVKKTDANHKTDLNDVNAYSGDGGEEQVAKRETSFPNDFLGLPRDANYFFDDLEPFINNYTDTRVGRAAPTRDGKIQKGRVASVKEKDGLDEDVEEDEEEDVNEEEEKLNEEDYDDDDDLDSDCQPTTGCSTTTTCRTTTPKCTTTPACTTEPKCTTKCPKLCNKVTKRPSYPPKQSGCCLEEKKKLKGGKRRLHSQNH